MKVSVSFLKSKTSRNNTIKQIDQTNCDFLHVDIMDGQFVLEKTDNIYEDIKNTSKKLEIHLMCANPLEYINKYQDLKPEYITIHFEIEKNIEELINIIKSKNIKVGLAINPETDVEKLKPYLRKIDQVLVLSVHPGKGGQEFIKESVLKVQKLASLRQEVNGNFLISIDGGINNKTIKLLKNTGLDMCVAGSYVCMSKNYQKRINQLKNQKSNIRIFSLIIVIFIFLIALASFFTYNFIKKEKIDNEYNSILNNAKEVYDLITNNESYYQKENGIFKNINIILDKNKKCESDEKNICLDKNYSLFSKLNTIYANINNDGKILLLINYGNFGCYNKDTEMVCKNKIKQNEIYNEYEKYPKYQTGDYVQLMDNTYWYVINDSFKADSYITLLKAETIGQKAFDTTGIDEYNPTLSTNIGNYLENEYKNSLNYKNLKYVSLLTYEDANNLTSILGDNWANEILTKIWLKDFKNKEGTLKIILKYENNNGNRLVNMPDVNAMDLYEVKPVITISKDNIKEININEK